MKLKKSIATTTLLTILALIGSHTAFADVTAVYKMSSKNGNGSQTIQYSDKQHIRVDMAGASYRGLSLMKLDDKVYMINGKVVQDLGQLAAMMAMMGKGSKKSPAKHAPMNYTDTGRTETIAGITGKVYIFEERGKKHEIVLGQDKDLQAAVLGLIELTSTASAMMGSGGMTPFQQDAALKNMAMLRMDNLIQLQSLHKEDIPKSVFVLPAKPQQMGGMGALMEGLMKK